MASYVVECASNSNDIDTLITTELAPPLLTVPEATGGQTGQARSLKLPRSDSVCVFCGSDLQNGKVLLLVHP